MGFTLFVTGPRACFRRPEFAVDLITYDVIPPITARSLFEAVHWTPAIRWTVERIEVLHPIRIEWLDPSRNPDGFRQQHLVDVAYVIDARFALTALAEDRDSAGRHAAIFRRRLKGGRYHQTPFLGRHGLVASLHMIEENEARPSFYSESGPIDLGWMVFDRDTDGERQMRYYRPVMIDGVIDLSNLPDMRHAPR